MKNPLFSMEEARRVAWETDPKTLALQLHQWSVRGNLIRLKRGIYAFPEFLDSKSEVARKLHPPCYISLESALSGYGLIPDVVFSLTLVTPRTTRSFRTPAGEFVYHHLKRELFWGYNPETLMGEREKVILDYFHLYGKRLTPAVDFWKEARWQNLEDVDFEKLQELARKFGTCKAVQLARTLAAFSNEV